MEKTYKYEISKDKFNMIERYDQVQYEPIYQYRHKDPGIWLDCKNNSYSEYDLSDIDTRTIYRLKQI